MFRSTCILMFLACAASAASAQSLGTFRWQFQPYCNVVSVTVTQAGGIYTFDGFDDQCGAATRAPATGLATLNPDGTIEIGLAIVTTPDAAPVHVAARISFATLSGTWQDSAGGTGNFVLTPGGGAGGSPRPASAGLTVSALSVVTEGGTAGPLTAGAGTFGSVTTTGEAIIGGNVNARNIFSNNGFIGIDAFNNVAIGAATLEFTRGRGTAQSIALPLNGDRLATINFKGVTNPAGGYRSGATVSVNATESWSFNGSGASLTFSTNPNASNATLPRLFIDHNGEVGIGTLTPDQLLSVNGGASKVGGGSWSVFSDERLKTVHGAFSRGLDAVAELEPIRFEYRSDNPLGLRAGAEYVGFSAQAVQKVIPEAVSTAENGYLRLDADPILWTMLNAIKELKGENDALKAQLTALRERLEQVELSRQEQR